MLITMPRGDIRRIHFVVSDSLGNETDVDFDEIFFTVKRSFQDRAILFQKRQSNGTIWKADDGGYDQKIMPEDTNDLKYGQYVFDVELVQGDEIKQTNVGNFVLTNEVTFVADEE